MQLPGVPHLQDADRVRAAAKALAVNPRQVLVLDDAFQHRRLARDLDVVLLDALAPFGHCHLLPRGLLREPIASLARANVIALLRSDAVSAVERENIEQDVKRMTPRAVWLELIHRRQDWSRLPANVCRLKNYVASGSRHFAVSAIRPVFAIRCGPAG